MSRPPARWTPSCLLLAALPCRGAAQGLFYLQGPDPEWRNEADCGFQTFKDPTTGITRELNCAAPKRAHFMDTDGSLTGAPGSVNGWYGTTRGIPYDQVSITAGPRRPWL